MLRSISYVLALTVSFFSAAALAMSADEKLALIISAYGLRPVSCNVNEALEDKRLAAVGDIVFNTPVMSGDKDTSCSTCHIDAQELTDGLPISVGVGGKGEGTERMQSSDGVLVPRNSFTLFGRASSDYKVFFWDGKVQEYEGKIYSPVGEGYALGFRSPLAVAAIMPLLARDEFLGKQHLIGSNESLNQINEEYYRQKLEAADHVLRDVLDRQDVESKKLKRALDSANISSPSMIDIGNALAAFIAKKVSTCTESKWEHYLRGDSAALTDSQKQGAVIFYGKGRCAACHSGSEFSDFKFHSIGVPQGAFGPYIHNQDIGRADVTYQETDRFKFRTPPLMRVAKTSPYGHNGQFATLQDIVLFHLNPVPYLSKNGWSSFREMINYGQIIDRRDDVLKYVDIKDESELGDLIDFLKAL